MNEQVLRDWLEKLHGEVDRTNSQFPKNLTAGWPVPFFGDVLKARVLTVGVNPSDREFNPTRRWTEVTNLAQWQARMLGYFQNEGVPPWVWFETWSICLALLDLCYVGGAAHLDVSPRPTTPMLAPVTDQSEFRRMTEHDVRWFFELLNQLPNVQLLLVAGPIPRGDGKKQQLAEFLRESASRHGAQWVEAKPLPVFTCKFEPEVHGLYSMVRQVYQHHDLLRRLAMPPNYPTPVLPARLDWPSVIGSFLLSFGSLEYFVFVYLKDHLAEAEFEKVKNWHLMDRLKHIAQHLADKLCAQAEQDAFADLVARVTPLRELRNHIAHGQIYERLNPETGKPKIVLLLAKDVDSASMPETRELDFVELERALTELSGVNREFERFAGFQADNKDGTR